ncbi:unnamed protein product [Owenia fusiformis]|uniref:Uncharacterized protein n=1 Tax=Owenia fusiformis TaxID=6347 RepID=A0A8J1Y0K9_OWEFU|nr:unnamed protein product [Owenia fusiformis]
MDLKIMRDMTLKCSHRDTGWSNETTILNSLLENVHEDDLIAIQISRRDVHITFASQTAKSQAKKFGIHINGLYVELLEDENDNMKITLRDIPIQVNDEVINAYIAQFAKVTGNIYHGYVKNTSGERTRIKDGVRFIHVTEIMRPIPNNPTIAGFMGRLSYRGQPCGICNEVGHPDYRCDKRRKPVCFNCQQPGHFAKTCTLEPVCHKCKGQGHRGNDCPAPLNASKTIMTEDEQKNTKASDKSIKSSDSPQIDTIITGCSIAKGIYTSMKREGVSEKTKSGAGIEDIDILMKRDKIDNQCLEKIIIQAGTKNLVYDNERVESCLVKYESCVKSLHLRHPQASIVISSITPVHPYDKKIQGKIDTMNKQLNMMCRREDFLVFVNNDAMLLSNQGKTSKSDFKENDVKGVHLSPHGYNKVANHINSVATPRNKRKTRGSDGSTPGTIENEPKKALYSNIVEENE